MTGICTSCAIISPPRVAGQGSLVLIGGEAGIGKTALAEALCREAADAGRARARRALLRPDRDAALRPLARTLRPLPPEPTVSPPLPPAFAAARHGRRGGESGGPLRGRCATSSPPSPPRGPLVLLLDDLHWADPASLDLLRFLARSVATLPLLILATYRSDELTRRHPALPAPPPARARGARRRASTCARLADDAIRALVAARYALAGGGARPARRLSPARAEGNAFFVGELLRALEEEGGCGSEGRRLGRWGIWRSAAVPVAAAAGDRRAGGAAGRGGAAALAVAAVIGQEVPLASGRRWAGRTRTTLLAVVEQAAAARLMDGDAGRRRAVRFVHALIREALYEGILASRRRRLHRRVGEALAALPQPRPRRGRLPLPAGGRRARRPLAGAGGGAGAAAYALADRGGAVWRRRSRCWSGGSRRRGGQRGWLLCPPRSVCRRVRDSEEAIRRPEEADDPAMAADDRALPARLRLFMAAPASRSARSRRRGAGGGGGAGGAAARCAGAHRRAEGRVTIASLADARPCSRGYSRLPVRIDEALGLLGLTACDTADAALDALGYTGGSPSISSRTPRWRAGRGRRARMRAHGEIYSAVGKIRACSRATLTGFLQRTSCAISADDRPRSTRLRRRRSGRGRGRQTMQLIASFPLRVLRSPWTSSAGRGMRRSTAVAIALRHSGSQ